MDFSDTVLSTMEIVSYYTPASVGSSYQMRG